MNRIGVDLAKAVLHGVDSQETVTLRRKLRRNQHAVKLGEPISLDYEFRA